MKTETGTENFHLFKGSHLSNEGKRSGFRNQGLCDLAEAMTLTQKTDTFFSLSRSFHETQHPVPGHIRAKGNEVLPSEGSRVTGTQGCKAIITTRGDEHGQHTHCAWLESLGRVHRSNEFLV